VYLKAALQAVEQETKTKDRTQLPNPKHLVMVSGCGGLVILPFCKELRCLS